MGHESGTAWASVSLAASSSQQSTFGSKNYAHRNMFLNKSLQVSGSDYEDFQTFVWT